MLEKTKSVGFTVVEVLVGIGIFGLVMPVIIVAVVEVSRLNDRAADLTRANIIADEKIESLRSAGYNSLLPGTVDFTNELDASFTQPRSATYTITEPPQPGTKIINIEINYTDQGNPRILTFQSIMSELGVAQ